MSGNTKTQLLLYRIKDNFFLFPMWGSHGLGAATEVAKYPVPSEKWLHEILLVTEQRQLQIKAFTKHFVGESQVPL